MKYCHCLLLILSIVSACTNKVNYEEHDGYTLAFQSKGPTLGFSSAPILEINGLLFKDLDRNGELTPYED